MTNIPHGRPKNGARDTTPQHISPPNIEKFTFRILAVCGKRGKIDMVPQSVDKDKKALNRSPSSINLIFKNSQTLKMVVFSATHPKKSSTSMQVNSQAQRIHVKNS